MSKSKVKNAIYCSLLVPRWVAALDFIFSVLEHFHTMQKVPVNLARNSVSLSVSWTESTKNVIFPNLNCWSSHRLSKGEQQKKAGLKSSLDHGSLHRYSVEISVTTYTSHTVYCTLTLDTLKKWFAFSKTPCCIFLVLTFFGYNSLRLCKRLVYMFL